MRFIKQFKSDDFEYGSDDIKFRYLGLYKDENIDVFNEHFINLLVSDKVLIESEFYNDNFNKADSIDFQIPLYFNRKSYYLNKEIVFEIFNFLEWSVSGMGDGGWESDEIIYNSQRFLDDKDKLSYLKKVYEDKFPKGPNEPFLLSIYRNEGDKFAFSNGVRNWMDWLEINLEFYPQVVKLFLTYQYNKNYGDHIIDQFAPFYSYLLDNKEKIDEGFFEFMEDWKNTSQQNLILTNISDKIKTLEEEINNTPQRTTPPPPRKITKFITLENILASKKEEDYKTLIDKLVESKIIEKENHNFEIIIPEKFKKAENYFMVAIATRLRQKGYIRDCIDDKDVIEAMNNTFENCHLSKQNYSSFKDSTRQQAYYKYLNDMGL